MRRARPSPAAPRDPLAHRRPVRHTGLARRHLIAALALVAVATACVPARDEATVDAPRTERSVVVASFNFPESQVLAEMYALMLDDAGVPVHRELGLGPRELVEPALLQGFVDVVPEYSGTALASLDARAAELGHDAVQPSLEAAFAARGVRVLAPAQAENQNGVVVTRATALRLALETVSDLAVAARSLTLGGPPECPSRRYCLPGLEDTYGLRFAEFVPIDGAARVARALRDGVVDVAVMFTTDGHLATRDLVLLDDDRHLQPPEHVVPVVRQDALARHGDEVVAALDRVSARLTTTALRFLNWRVSVAGNEPRSEARGWLVRQGLLPR